MTWVMAVAVLVAVTGVLRAWRRVVTSRDQVYQGVAPGVVPPGQHRVVRLPRAQYQGPVAVAFTPPRGVPAGLAGMVVDGRVEPRDVGASIVDLAVRGFLRIDIVETAQQTNWRLHRLEHDGELLGYEWAFLKSAFVAGRPVLMSELLEQRRGALQALIAGLYDEAMRRGWYAANPNPGRSRHRRRWLLVGALTGLFIWVLLPGEAAAAALFVVAGALESYRPARRVPRTALGTAVRIQALGFEQYLSAAEADRIRDEEAQAVFSRYLPYAMAFGVAGLWLRSFKQVQAERGDVWQPRDFDWLASVEGAADNVFRLVESGLLSDGLAMAITGAKLVKGVGSLVWDWDCWG